MNEISWIDRVIINGFMNVKPGLKVAVMNANTH